MGFFPAILVVSGGKFQILYNIAIAFYFRQHVDRLYKVMHTPRFI